MRNLRLPLPVLLLALAAPTTAQTPGVELRMKWGNPPKTCVIYTDADGVALAGDGALEFNGTQAPTNCPGGDGGTITDPVITNDLDATELPAEVLVGTNTTVHWAAEADSCSYAGSSFPSALATWPTLGAGATPCSSAAGCAADHVVNLSFAQAGTYTFKLTCSKAGAANPAVSTRSVTVSEQPSGNCIAPTGLRRLLSGQVRYNSTASYPPRTADLTRFESVFGHDQYDGPLRPFPGTINLTQRIMLPEDNYVALQFTVPDNFNSATQGSYALEESAVNDRPDMVSITISKRCGDFRPAAVTPMTDRCILNASQLNGSIPWGNVGLTSRCQLQAGQTYYLNILYASLDDPTTSGCNIASCGAPILNRKTGPATGHIWQGVATP